MGRYDDDWGARRPNTRARRRKPYNDDYKDDDRRRGRRSYAYREDAYREDDYRADDDVRIYETTRERREDGTGDPRTGGRERPYEEPARRSPYPEEAKRRARRPRRRGRGLGCLIPLIVVLLIAGAVVIAGMTMLGRLWDLVDSANFRTSDIAVNADLPASVKKSAKDYRTIMLFGVDSRDNTTLQSGVLSDSNIVVAIHKRTGAVKLLSIYRDTYVETTTGDHLKLTEVYSKYGAKEQLQTINRNFDMNVSEYVTVNWKAVADTINKLGGIDLDLSEDECRGINKYIDEVMESTGLSSSHIDVDDGVQHVDGVQAVTYCRLRKGLGDDYRRTERQRTVIAKTFARARSAGIPAVMKICEEIFPGISSSLSLTEVMTLAAGLGRFEIIESAGFPFDQATQDGGRYYLFPVTLSSNAKELHEYLYGDTEYTPSATVQGISQAVADFSGYYGN